MEKQGTKKKILKSIKAKAALKRTLPEKLADFMTSVFGSMTFLVLNVLLFLFWLVVNTGQLKSVPIFDPFPFTLLTTIVSLEAIILAIFVLVSQNRSSRVDDLREETNLQLNVIERAELTKIIKMLAILLEKQGFDLTKDSELKKMIRPATEEEIESSLEKEIL